jgi:hypothetical protein
MKGKQMNQLSLKTVGLAAGILFFAHAMVPNSNAWPMVWPALAGALAAYRAARPGRGFLVGVGRAGGAGAIAGVLFLFATAAVLALLSMSSFAPVARTLGADGPVALNGAVLAGLGFAAALGVVLAACAGALVYPLARRRT